MRSSKPTPAPRRCSARARVGLVAHHDRDPARACRPPAPSSARSTSRGWARSGRSHPSSAPTAHADADERLDVEPPGSAAHSHPLERLVEGRPARGSSTRARRWTTPPRPTTATASEWTAIRRPGPAPSGQHSPGRRPARQARRSPAPRRRGALGELADERRHGAAVQAVRTELSARSRPATWTSRRMALELSRRMVSGWNRSEDVRTGCLPLQRMFSVRCNKPCACQSSIGGDCRPRAVETSRDLPAARALSSGCRRWLGQASSG
jgi:hypothetical protein